MAFLDDLLGIVTGAGPIANIINGAAANLPLQPGGDMESLPITEGYILDLLAVQGGKDLGGIGLSDRIYFKYTFNQFEESKSANYAEVNVMGRSEPILGYAGSGPRMFTIPLVFAATEQNFHFSQVIAPIWLIRSWLYPDYNTTQQPQAPPPLLLVMGAWLSQRCVARSATIRYHGPWGRTHLKQAAFDALWRGRIDNPGGVLAMLQEGFLNGSSQLEMIPAGIKFLNPMSAFRDSMLPMWVEVNLVLQETMDNTSYTPYDTRYVRNGKDIGSGFFY